jgi:hypothetical protein
MRGLRKYILDQDGNPVPVEDVLQWAQWFTYNDRHLDIDTIEGIGISTVFLGLDHGFDSNQPVLWETMIFGGEHDGYQKRYFTKVGAQAGHTKAVEMVKQSLYETKNGQALDNRGSQEAPDVAGDEPVH